MLLFFPQEPLLLELLEFLLQPPPDPPFFEVCQGVVTKACLGFCYYLRGS
jgi:hypothetical protein